jgi:diguanylate cyclase (GGDEF)-like protein
VLGRNPKLLSSGRQGMEFYEEMWKSLKEAKAWRGEIWNRRKNGEIYAELLSISAICDDAGVVQRHVGVFSDITYFKEHEAELSQVANFDALTGVPNRRLLADRLRQAIAHAQRSGKMLAICYIDLDGFKDVNDQHGHEIGDRLLVDIAQRLQDVLRAGDTLARLGGDEFVVLFNDLTQESECFQVLDRLMQTIAAPMMVGNQPVAVSASIGVTFYPADDEDGDTLMRHADQAMYIAKQTGKNRYHPYDAIHDQRVRSLHESRRRIMQGLEDGEFELYYQPKLELASNKVVGVEALIRWHHPERGLLSPIEFLPLLENSDMEIKLGKWVMRTALAQLHAWERGGVVLQVSVNISARHLQSPDFVADLKHQLERYPGIMHGRLQIEVLETAALEDMGQSFEIIEACRNLGVSFALDDFGTGYSSLVYLRKLGADTLKIDQSFVQNMANNEGDRAIVQGVIALARTFNRETVAEGLEDPKLVQTLAEMGCGYGQGYGIAHPMPGGEFLDWYKKR